MVAFFVKNNKRRWLVGSGSAGLADGGLLHRDGRGSGEWAIDGKVGLVGGRGGAVSAERNLPWMFVWFGIILTDAENLGIGWDPASHTRHMWAPP